MEAFFFALKGRQPLGCPVLSCFLLARHQQRGLCRGAANFPRVRRTFRDISRGWRRIGG
jgi:hypothetical protein